MNYKNTAAAGKIAAAASLAMALALGASGTAHAEGYEYAGGVSPILTFEFKDGTEVHEFPLFVMEDDFIANSGSPGFSIQGIVGDAPHLHRMLDTAFKHKYSNAHEWNYQYAGITVDFVKEGKPVRTLEYHDCEVEDYQVNTLMDDYESYMQSKTGFAIVDYVEFLCGGLNPSSPSPARYAPGGVTTHETGFSYYGDIRTFVEFEFDQGTERIEFPYFELLGGFEEDTSNVTPSFRVEGVVGDYPLLHKAIDNARGIRGMITHSNIDFEANVQFVRDGVVLRELDFGDCRTTAYKIKVLSDKEEGFTGKSGFAPVEEVEVECVGLEGVNPRYGDVYGNGATWQTTRLSYDAPDPGYVSAGGMAAAVRFDYDHGHETAVFPYFRQGDVLGLNDIGTADISVPPTFVLAGEISDLPMLYERADENLDIAFTTGPHNFIDLFGVDVRIVEGAGAYAKTVRGFGYSDCRITDYSVRTQHDKETSYFKGFAHTNEFDFECLGYHPYDPGYDALFSSEQPDATYNSVDYQREQAERREAQAMFG